MQCAKGNTSESCKCICQFSEENISAQIIQLITQDRSVKVSLVEQPTTSSNTTVLLTHSPANGVLVLSFLATVVRVTFQSFPNGTTSTTTSPCQCQKIFAILQNIFVVKNLKVNPAHICKENSSTCEASNAVPSALVNQVDSRMTALFTLKDSMASLVTTATSTFFEISKELQKIRLKYNEKLTQLYDLLQKNVCAHSLETGIELQASQQNRSSGDSASSQTTQSQGRSSDISLHQTNHYPLTKLLHYFSINLLPKEWYELRLATSRRLRQPSNLPNDIGIFHELVNRKLISHQNLDLLHQIFTEVQRFDYVHLIDRIREGDNSLLDECFEDQRLPNDTGASNSQSVATVQEIPRPTVKEHRPEDASSFQRKRDIKGGSLVDQASRDLKQDKGDDQEGNGGLSRRYNNSPPVSQVSLTVPVQEVSARVEVDGAPRDLVGSRNGDVRVTSPVSQPQQQTRHHGKTGSSHDVSKQSGSNQTGSNQAESNQAGSNQAGSNHTENNQAGSNQAGSNQTENNQAGSNQAGSNQAGSNQAGSNHTENNQAGSNQAGSNHTENNQGGSNQAGSNHTENNQAGSNYPGSNQAGSNHPESNHAEMNHTGSSHTESNQVGSKHAGSNRGGSNQGESIQSGSNLKGSNQAGNRSTNEGDNHDGSNRDESLNGSSQTESDRGGSNHAGSSHDGSNRGKQAKQGLRGGSKAETKAKLKFSCEHYDRYCHVQFSCCDKFWPCHRCHNTENPCAGNGKLRSIDIKKIKCRRCQKIQEFPKERPNCEECGLKFAEYFCAPCQHLTGKQCSPYHCIGCGICRINEDRSFHCDVCGVCLDVHLLENHKCRAGSAHDECCICFEDAFTGCQILPCSHKVHKDCATEMLKNGITKCPVCRQSFAHLVQRRQPENSSK